MLFRLALLALLALNACAPATLKAVGEGEQQQAPNAPPETAFPPKPDDPPPAVPGEPEPAPNQPTNSDPAEMEITAPPRGARVIGDRVRVSGRITGGNSPQVTIGGTAVTVGSDGRFHLDVPVTDGVAILISRMVDGNVTSEDHRAVIVNGDVEPGSQIDDAISVLISDQGFATISQLVSNFAADLDLAGIAQGQGGGDFQITEVRFDRIDLTLTPGNGALDLNMKVWGLYIAIRAEVDIIFGIDITVRGHMNADPTINARLNLAADGQGSMSLAIDNAQVSMDNFGYNINNVPGEVEQWFEDQIVETAESTLRDALNGVVVPNLFDAEALDQELDLLGKAVDLNMAIQTVDIDPSGMRIGMNASALAQNVTNFGKAVRQLGGPNGEVPEAEIDIGLASDFINRLLHAVWASGALNIYIGGPQDSGLGVDLPFTIGLLAGALGEAAEGVDRAGNLTIAMRAALPPVCYVDDTERPLKIIIGDMLIDLGEAAAGTLVTLAVHLEMHIGLEANDLGELEPQIDLEYHVDVAEEPRGKTNKAQLEMLIGTVMNSLPNLLGDALAGAEADGAEPAPAAPIALMNTRFLAIGAFLHVLADIDPNPAAPIAP